MTKRSNNSKPNSARKTVDNLSRPSPRMNLRGRLNDNVTHITANEYNNPAIVTSGNTLGYGIVYLAPGNTTNKVAAPANAVGQYFQKGLYLPGSYVRYIPSVGLTTVGNVIMGYIDNPSSMLNYLALAAGAQLNYIRGLSNAKTGPVWQELTFPITAPPRRKIFSADGSIGVSSADELDQAMQGFVVWCVYGTTTATADTTYGQLLIHSKLRFEEVKTTLTT